MNWQFYFKVKPANQDKNDKCLEAGIDFVPMSVIKLLNSKDFTDVKPSIVCFRSDNPDIIEHKKEILDQYGATQISPFGVVSITPLYTKDVENGKLIKKDEPIVNIIMALPLVTGNGYNSHVTEIDKFYDDLAKTSGSIKFLREVLFADQIESNEDFKSVCMSSNFIDTILDAIKSGRAISKTPIPLYDGYIGKFKFIELNCSHVLEFAPYMKDGAIRTSSQFQESIQNWYTKIVKNCINLKNAVFAYLKKKPSLKVFNDSSVAFVDCEHLANDIFSLNNNALKRIFNRTFVFSGSDVFKLDNWVLSFISYISLYNLFLNKLCVNDKDIENVAVKAIGKDGDIDENKLIYSPEANNSFTNFKKIAFIERANNFLDRSIRSTHRILEKSAEINSSLKEYTELDCCVDINDQLKDGFNNPDSFSNAPLDSIFDQFRSKNIELYNKDESVLDSISNKFDIPMSVLKEFLLETEVYERNTNKRKQICLYEFGFLPISIEIDNKICFLPAWYNPISKSLFVTHELVKRLMFTIDGSLENESINKIESSIFYNNTKVNFSNTLLDEIVQEDSSEFDVLIKRNEIKAFIAILSLIIDGVKEYDKLLTNFANQSSALIKNYLTNKDFAIDSSDNMSFIPTLKNKCARNTNYNAELLEIDLDEVKYDKSVKALAYKEQKETQDKEYILNDISCLLSPSIENDATITALANAIDVKDDNLYKLRDQNPGVKVQGALIKNDGIVSIEEVSDDNTSENDIDDTVLDSITKQLKKRIFDKSFHELSDYRIFYMLMFMDKIKPLDLIQKRQRLLREVSSLEDQIGLLKANSITQSNQLANWTDKIKHDSEVFVGAKINSIVEQLNALLHVPQIGSISIDDENKWLIVSTKHDILVKDERSDLKYNLGRLCFCIPFDLYDKNYLRSKNASALRWIAYSRKNEYLQVFYDNKSANDSKYGPYAVVHGYSNGCVCLGDSAPALNNAIASYNLVMLVMLMLQYAESMNPKDPWGRRCNRWLLKELDLKEYLSTFFVNDPMSIRLDKIAEKKNLGDCAQGNICTDLTISEVCRAFDCQKSLSKREIVDIISELNRTSKLGTNTSCLLQYIDYLDIDILRSSYMQTNPGETACTCNPYGGVVLSVEENTPGITPMSFIDLKLANANWNRGILKDNQVVGLGYFGAITELINNYPCLKNKLVVPIPNIETKESAKKLGLYLTYSNIGYDSQTSLAYKYITDTVVNYGVNSSAYSSSYISPCVTYMNILDHEHKELGLNVLILPKKPRSQQLVLSFFFASKDAAKANGINFTSDGIQNGMLRFINRNKEEICNKLGFLEPVD